MKYLLPLIFSILAGCNSVPERMDIMDYEPTFHKYEAPKRENGSLFYKNQSYSLFKEPLASNVGDVLTVLLVEDMSAQKSNSSNSNKTTEASVDPMTILGAGVTTAGLGGVDSSIGVSSENNFSGSGGASQSNAVDGKITVTVNRVLPNGYLFVKGEKWIQINTGDELVQVSGVVRPFDILSGNEIESTKIADARIVYAGKGFLNESSEPGWLFKVFNSSWWPL